MGKMLLTEYALGGRTCWWLAPTYGMAGQVWRDLKTTFRRFDGVHISESEKRIDIPGCNGVIAVRSTYHPDYLRGAGLDLAILDEAAFMLPNVWSEIVRPMLIERRGKAVFLSTPRGLNWFWELWRLGLDPEADDWSSFTFTTADNPAIPPEEFAALKRLTPERVFAEEYLAQFMADTGRVFRGVHEAATAPLDAQPDPTHRYIAGIDWARENDYTCIVVLDADTGAMVALDRFNRIGWELQRGRLRAMCDLWQPSVVWAEANSIGAVNIEALQNEGLPVRAFQTTTQSKAPLIDALALGIERRELALLPDDVLLRELIAYTLERSPGGGYRYSAPPGGHDDTVIALALAWHGMEHSGRVIDFA